MLLDSFTSLPIGIEGITKTDIWTILSLEQPYVCRWLIVDDAHHCQLVAGQYQFWCRYPGSAATEYIFSGFSGHLMLGMILVWLTLPDVLDQFTGILTESYDLIGQVAAVCKG